MRIALVHDSLVQYGGAERVLEAVHELYPEAPVFTLVCSDEFRGRHPDWDIRTSWLQTIYKFIPRLQYLLTLIPWAVKSFKFEGYDIVFSLSSGFVKNISVPAHTAHINYCHTPARFLWLNANYTRQELPWLLKPAIPLLHLFLMWMKRWDLAGSNRVTRFIANSKEVQNRIKQFYHLESEIIYPFVDTDFWKPARPKQDYFLIAGRLHAHKGSELIVEIFNELGRLLHVVGTGRQEAYLKSIAKPNITFLGRVPDEALRDEYSGALGFIYPQFEDFGMMPLEAAACGTATLGLAAGGSLETIIPGVTGELFERQDKEMIQQAIVRWDASEYSVNTLQEHACKFSKDIFQKKLSGFISSLTKS